MTDTQPLSAEELENYLGWIRGTCIDAGKGCLPSTIDARSVLRLINQLTADREHWKERATRAEANQRTPGTVEVCENCGDMFPRKKCDHPRDFTGEAWAKPCPIRQETER